jgi:hypothetical protein
MSHLKISIVVTVLLLGLGLTHSELTTAQIPGVRESHIDGNVPEKKDFDRFLKRDLTAFFQEGTKGRVRVEYELLRKEPTQSGVAFPKFYLWVKAFQGRKLLVEGAARVAAVEKKRFDVVNFREKAEIQKDPDAVANAFPAALVPEILRRAGVKPATN